MRLNTPVTQQEYRLAEGDLLISRTNLQGKITYANPAFVEASGFTLEELMGSDHNLVRHPDMPVEAFANFWTTIKQGEIWSGLVKNRRKNGDHYWVRANVVPVREAGKVVGYASLRTCLSRADAAKEIHQLIANANQEIDAGAEVVARTESAIGRVVEASNRVNDIMEEISAASREQSSGITQISDAVSQMEQAVQQSAGQLQESGRAAHQLQHETWQLNNAILAFRTQGSGQELQVEIDVASVTTQGESAPPVRLATPRPTQQKASATSGRDWMSF
ncbi:methyl-accepting chemotaxis protein [Halomonas salipaludis]|uniref:PAS domain-containing protein n=1 Tax=Halomonas salipaludis TaxID=2032625 RepID=A0A2A2ENJ6_9GAMM|nr:PAS domain-containing methyl-accepting chemotaxis protein [Halomonas salipaludis]PAU74686.1 hypothetical protein CK498_21425 [Halomonas salipaludis]